MADLMITKHHFKDSEADKLQNKARPKRTQRKNRYKSYKRLKKISSGRKCRICGKDPYPNYFFCPGCHHKIETYEEK